MAKPPEYQWNAQQRYTPDTAEKERIRASSMGAQALREQNTLSPNQFTLNQRERARKQNGGGDVEDVGGSTGSSDDRSTADEEQQAQIELDFERLRRSILLKDFSKREVTDEEIRDAIFTCIKGGETVTIPAVGKHILGMCHRKLAAEIYSELPVPEGVNVDRIIKNVMGEIYAAEGDYKNIMKLSRKMLPARIKTAIRGASMTPTMSASQVAQGNAAGYAASRLKTVAGRGK
jgi:hypothetical protein